MSSPHINAPIQARMYANTLHKVIWVVVVVASAGLLAPPLFFIAAKDWNQNDVSVARE